jgi:toxin HigB-1
MQNTFTPLCITVDDIIQKGYHFSMIRSFKDKEAEKVFSGQFSEKVPHNIQRIAERKLIMLHRSANLNDLRVPSSNRLEALKGDRSGQHSIRINDQWRICFEWREDGVYEVEIVDGTAAAIIEVTR